MRATIFSYDRDTGSRTQLGQIESGALNDAASSSNSGAAFVVGSLPACDLVLTGPRWSPRHISFTWSPSISSWRLVNVSSAPLRADGQIVEPNGTFPLLLWESTILVAEMELRFVRTPDAPVYEETVANSIPLDARGLIIGRGGRNRRDSSAPRLSLDADMRTISSLQAEISWVEGEFVLKNLCQRDASRTILNGDQNFDERRLVLGDCIQIPNCDYYTFKFTGEGLKHTGEGGILQGVGLTVDIEDGRILHEVNLDLRRGDFLGIIGGSGQGKTTLMRAMCGISPPTSGFSVVDGFRLKSPGDVARASIGYVPQDDIVHKELLVIDALTFGARLRLRASTRQIRDLVQATMETLGLSEHQFKQVRLLSGGQRKRVSIAVELLANPDYLFLDEPTSGLDPQNERRLMGELSALARRRRMGVACTTHILQNCHVLSRLLFISRGRLIFLGAPSDAVHFIVYQRPGPEGDPGMDERHEAPELTDADLSGKISMAYEIVQDEMIGEDQDRVAESWQRRYENSGFYVRPAPPNEAHDALPQSKTPSALLCAALLIARQWKLLLSSPWNLAFLTAQAAIIGILIGWVTDSLVLQMFLSLIATLWFGCSNGAQQIVGELPILHRERLAGLGVHTYTLSKLTFWTSVTAVQALLLFLTVTTFSIVAHPDKEPDLEGAEKDARGVVPDRQTRYFRTAFFDKASWRSLLLDEQDGASTRIPGLDDAPDMQPVQRSFNPTGLRPNAGSYRALESIAGFFRLRENILPLLKVRPLEIGEEGQPQSWVALVALLLGLQILSLLLAALVGVALGLAISALVESSTQAVMWVPLVLIPQILFGSIVVIVPEMEDSVLTFSRFLPSFNSQRIMDVALLYGRALPMMTNDTRIPGFMATPPDDDETVWWGDRQKTDYKRQSEVNKSWQNLAVDRALLGARHKESDLSVEERVDVSFGGGPVKKGSLYLETAPAHSSSLVLIGWTILCYSVTTAALHRRQAPR